METPFGIGVYTIPEAARLSRVPKRTLRRWACGYRFAQKDGRLTESPPLWTRELPPGEDGRTLLTFRDLIEAKWVSFFLDQRVTWKAIRTAGARAARELEVSHPFSTGRFAAIVTGSEERPRALIAERLPQSMREVLTDQYVIDSVMAPFVRQLEFDGDRVLRWFPMERSRRIVVDPEVRFGAPTVASGVPTEILWENHEHGGASYAELADWWGIPEREIRDAVRWERSLRAA